jgi:Methylamine utilisation protein MauE
VSAAYGQIVAAAALLAGIVLICAGLPKAVRSGAFAAQIADYGLVPQALTGVAARLISSLELAAGVLLVAGLAAPHLRQAGAGLAMILFVVFAGALASAYARGRNVACACFGGDSELELVGAHSIVRTALLLALAVVAVLPASAPPRPFEVVGLAAILAALVAMASELTRLLGPLSQATASIVEQLAADSAAADQAEVR